MAEVFLAKSTGAEGIEKILVVKRVLPTFSRSEKFISMFVDEAKVAMRLNHPNIVQVYAFEQVGEQFLLAMEFVDGLDLGRLVSAVRRRGERLSPALCAFIVMELAKGLDYAHNRRDESRVPMEIVHRDVSPQNVLISYDGVVKIADFGIARARLVSEETGVIKGKFAYMSPEQARGHHVDRRSDVYSLGVLLAELLMNRSMYPGQQGMEVLELVREGHLTLPRQVDTSVPTELDAVVRRATSLDREERYQSARSLAGALSQWLHGQDELWDGTDLESFIAEMAPREVTSPDHQDALEVNGSGAGITHPSMPHGRQRHKERRNVVALHGHFRGERDTAPITGVDRSGNSVAQQITGVLANIAYRSNAILDWPEGEGRGSFRLILGLGRVSVDDPLHAARTSLDVLDALAGLSADLLSPLSASIGLSRGILSISRSTDGRLRYQPLGGIFEVAERLALEANSGQCLVTGEIYRLARRAFAFDEADVRELKIGDTEVGPSHFRAYLMRGALTRDERTAQAVASAGEVGLFGRAMEIQALGETYREVIETQRSAYLALVGELGVGKGAIVAAALGGFSPDPRLLRVECIFGGADMPFSAVAEMVREACDIQENTSATEARRLLDKTLKRILPASLCASTRDTFERLIAPVAQKNGPRPDVTDGLQNLVRALRLLLGGLGREGPLVVWVDALQFADTPSLQVLGSLLSRNHDVPLLVVVCSRAGERVEEFLSAIPRIEVTELSADERSALIRARLDDASVPAEVEQAIIHRAGGNPFFLIELIDALLDRGTIQIEGEGEDKRVVREAGAAFMLPTTLEDVIAARLAALPHDERHTLRWLAVVGPGLRPKELLVLTGEDLSAELMNLEERGLVQQRALGAIYFPSPVVRHVAYESIDDEDRVQMHRMVAHYLNAQANVPAPARLAHHRERAGDLEGAAQAYLQAGHAARAMYSYRESLRFYGRGLALMPEDSPLAFDVHQSRDDILRAMGRRSEQGVELEAMRALAERNRDPSMVATAFNRLARYDLDAARPTGVDAMLRKALDAAIEIDDKAAEVEALRLLGQLRRDVGDVAGAIDALDRALARTAKDSAFLAARGQTQVQKAILLWRASRLEASLDACAEAVVIFRRLGLKSQEANALSCLGVALAHRGAFEDAIAVMRASVVIDREVGDRLHLGRKISNVGQLYAEMGDTQNALSFMRRALEIFDTVDDQSGRADTLCALAEVLMEQVGDLEAAKEMLRDARALSERGGDPYDLAHVELVETTLAMIDADYHRAAERAREATLHAKAAGARGYELLAQASRAQALARENKSAEARVLIESVQTELRRGDVERADRIHHHLALSLNLLGDKMASMTSFEKAMAVIDRRLDQVRSVSLREQYLASPLVQAIREELREP